MFKFIAVFALLAVASAAPGFVASHYAAVVQPAELSKTAVVDHSASSAITHQSFTNLERKVPVAFHTYSSAPLLKSVAAAPVVQAYAAQPIVKAVSAPIVHTYAAAPVVHQTYAAAPVVHQTYAAAAPVVHSYAAAPVVHAAAPVVHSTAPLLKTVVSSPVAYAAYH